MSIARALTVVSRKRGGSNEEPSQTLPARAGTLKRTDYKQVDRTKISLPITLLSTTNALAYDAPDIPKISTMISPSLSSASSRRSFSGSDSGASSATSISTPSLSREGSPALDCKFNGYFSPPSPKQPVSMELPPVAPLSPKFKEIEIPPTTPAVPTRALSHTKQNHQTLARKRSQARLSGENQSGPNSRAPSGEQQLQSLPEEHPFKAELAKVMEVAEDFGVKEPAIWNEEEQFLMDSGFGRFSAQDYINEVEPLWVKAFHETPFISNTPMWL